MCCQYFIKSLYGFTDLKNIEINKEILLKELDFINQSINGLANIIMVAIGVILTTALIYKDRLLCLYTPEILLFFIFLVILSIYLLIYNIEIFYKTKYKEEIIKKLKAIKEK